MVCKCLYNAAALMVLVIFCSTTEVAVLKEVNPLELLATNPVELAMTSLKSKLMIVLTMIIREKGLTQQEAAKVIGVSQPRISNLMNGKISKFSVDILIEMIGRMGYLMDISFRPDDSDMPIVIEMKKSAV